MSSTNTLKDVKEHIKRKEFQRGFMMLSKIARPEDNFPLQNRYSRLFQSIPKDALNLTPLKLAILGTSTLDHFADSLKFWLALEGFNVDIYLAPFGTLDQTVLDPNSNLYDFDADIIWLFTSHRDIHADLPFGTSRENLDQEMEEVLFRFSSLWQTLQKRGKAFVITNNADLPATLEFGHYEGTVGWGKSNFLRRFNLELAKSVTSGIAIFDIEYLSGLVGKNNWCDEAYWYLSKHGISFDTTGLVAYHGAKIISSIKGSSKKCLILDLDNTLWGGVIADDGVQEIKLGYGPEGEAFVAFQAYIKRLKDRGVILAVCSKNDEDNARLPFLNHPDMQLSLTDISVFVANWNSKADNIRLIAETLNIGLNALVFIDDNPVERAFVERELPMVAVPELPTDPSLFVRVLDQKRYFETITYSKEDSARGEMYKANAQRKDMQIKSADLNGFLADLNMKAIIGEFDEQNLPRISQLINKSNQFHLTTTRYPENAIRKMMADKGYVCRFFKLKDRFGDNGLISLFILKKSEEYLEVDTWVMSCRVLARGMEEFVHNKMVSIALVLGVRKIIGFYIPTQKNKLVLELFKRMGYEEKGVIENGTRWEFSISDQVKPKKHFIESVSNY
jgi:FkbH-like protein